MPRYRVRLKDSRGGSRSERDVSVEADDPRLARRVALALYGSDETKAVSASRERYFEYRQHRYCWTHQRPRGGTFSAIEFVPVGPGARTGKATRWRPTRELHFSTRKAAMECAQKWYETAKARDSGAKAAG